MKPEPRTAVVAALLVVIPLASALRPPALLASPGRGPEPAVNIGKILVEPGSFAAQLVLEAGEPLRVPRAYYLSGSPSTLVLDLLDAATSESPAIPASEASFIRDIQVQRPGPQELRLLVNLARRVPVRIRAESRRTVVVFTKVEQYILDTDTLARLDRRPKGGILLNKLDVAEAPDRVSFRAELSGQAEVQVFSLGNPTRLVVDVYDTVLRLKDENRTVDFPQIPVQKVRLAQFRESDPRPVTRLVFDLKEPGVYSVDSDDGALVVSFFKSMSASAPQEKANPVRVAAAEVPAPKPETSNPVAGQSPVQPPARTLAQPPAAGTAAPLIRKDLLASGGGEIPPPRRDIFHPRTYLQAPTPIVGLPTSRSKKGSVPEAPTFTLDLVYVGSVRAAGKITALVLMQGQTKPISEGDEIAPGYKVVRVTPDEIEIEGPNSERKTFARQGDRP
jgi:hypothetical protein